MDHPSINEGDAIENIPLSNWEKNRQTFYTGADRMKQTLFN